MDSVEFTFHPLCLRFPSLPPADFEALVESIRNNGLINPITVTEGNEILDGKNRFKALIELGTLSPENFRTLEGVDERGAAEFVFAQNIHRRHLSDDQRAALAAEFASFFRAEGGKRKAATQ